MLKENLKNVQNNIKKACERVGRKPEEVTLVAVSICRVQTTIC